MSKYALIVVLTTVGHQVSNVFSNISHGLGDVDAGDDCHPSRPAATGIVTVLVGAGARVAREPVWRPTLSHC